MGNDGGFVLLLVNKATLISCRGITRANGEHLHLPVVVLEIRHSRHHVRLRLVCLTLAVGNDQDAITCMLPWVILAWLSVSIVDVSNTPSILRLGNNSLSTFVSTPDQRLSSGRFLTNCALLGRTMGYCIAKTGVTMGRPHAHSRSYSQP
ncbi:hypothetical protein BJX66DRAFT_155006 [Aspergillus keveii]|uniref:Uncharacterized protein n=1 Tax=Aspergillus keveii TaxID=714993 RepID=A0ABR4GAJ9_9EURO